MNWARRLKRVFGIEIDSCARCGGRLKIIASIEEPRVIAKILSHLQHTAPQILAQVEAIYRQERASMACLAGLVAAGREPENELP